MNDATPYKPPERREESEHVCETCHKPLMVFIYPHQKIRVLEGVNINGAFYHHECGPKIVEIAA